MFQKKPEFTKFNVNHSFSKSISDYWTNPLLGGGDLTKPLKTKNVASIATPLAKMMQDTTNYGYYEINKIQLSESETSKYWMYDVALLATTEADAAKLKELS